MTEVQDHCVAFEMTEAGRRSLACFKASVPESWEADFYELFDDDPTGQIMLQYFRTSQPVDCFEASSLVRGLPGFIQSNWNNDQERITAIIAVAAVNPTLDQLIREAECVAAAEQIEQVNATDIQQMKEILARARQKLSKEEKRQKRT